MLIRWLTHPLTRGLSLDDPRTTALRRHIIKEKGFLRKIYQEWYGWLGQDVAQFTDAGGRVVEFGSGGGFLSEIIPECITSEVFLCPGVDIVADARALPFRDSSLTAILLVDVLHHMNDVERFLAEVTRTLRPGGILAMVEPWNTPWSRFIYDRLHHEPFDPQSETWDIPQSGPLSGANGALPWILFARDSDRFRQLFPCLQLVSLTLDFPFAYLASGGVSMRAIFPGWAYPTWRSLEKILSPFMSYLAMFAHIVVRRIDD